MQLSHFLIALIFLVDDTNFISLPQDTLQVSGMSLRNHLTLLPDSSGTFHLTHIKKSAALGINNKEEEKCFHEKRVIT